MTAPSPAVPGESEERLRQGARCLGLRGMLRGHKFTMLSNFEYRYFSDHCYRCGMPKGGWR